jgi:hypothetical protein
LDTIVLFVLRILIIITLWAFVGVAVLYILHERRTRPAIHPRRATRVRLDVDGQVAQGAGSQYQLSSRTTEWIGRDPNCVVRIDNEFVSLRHARIIWQVEQQSWWIEDQNSRNGTRVNEARVMRSELNDADIISIGGVRFRFETETR